MSFLSDLAPEAASRLLSVIAVGAFATAAAGAGTAVALTGSASPSDWAAQYQHSQECRQATAASDPSCSGAAARALAEKELAARLEKEAQDLKKPAAAPPGTTPPETAPAARPATNPAPAPSHSDGSEGGGDE